jgi:DNA-directed RNA polymerase subunit D
MSVELKFKDGNDVQFFYTGKSPLALRKFIMSETETYSFDTIEVQRNTSCLPDEILCLQLGLIIIQLTSIVPINHLFTLNVSGQSLGDSDSDNIYGVGGKWITSSDIYNSDIDFKYPEETPIIYLYPDQEINCVLQGKIGKGKEHTKWCPVSGITYTTIENDKFLFTMELTGALTWEQIHEQITLFLSKSERVSEIE